MKTTYLQNPEKFNLIYSEITIAKKTSTGAFIFYKLENSESGKFILVNKKENAFDKFKENFGIGAIWKE